MFLGAQKKPKVAMVTCLLAPGKSRPEGTWPLDAAGQERGWKGLEPPSPGHTLLSRPHSPLTHPEPDGHSHPTSAHGS